MLTRARTGPILEITTKTYTTCFMNMNVAENNFGHPLVARWPKLGAFSGKHHGNGNRMIWEPERGPGTALAIGGQILAFSGENTMKTDTVRFMNLNVAGNGFGCPWVSRWRKHHEN